TKSPSSPTPRPSRHWPKGSRPERCHPRRRLAPSTVAAGKQGDRGRPRSKHFSGIMAGRGRFWRPGRGTTAPTRSRRLLSVHVELTRNHSHRHEQPAKGSNGFGGVWHGRMGGGYSPLWGMSSANERASHRSGGAATRTLPGGSPTHPSSAHEE